jgi:polar amino acid transport system substrate-binding protein
MGRTRANVAGRALLTARLRLRGWGGVGAMVAVCLLALTASIIPLMHGSLSPFSKLSSMSDRGGTEVSSQATSGLAHARPTMADDSCVNPEASLRPSDATGPAVQRIKDRGYLIVGVDQNSYLWGYRDPGSGQIVGFDIDLVRAIATDILGTNPKIVFKTIPTDQRVPAIQSHEVDMVVRTMTINCERAKQVAFSTAYFEAGQQLLVPKTGTTITGLDESLAGKRVCTASGSTGETLLRGDPHGSRIVLVANQLDCLVRLQLGQVDAVLTDDALAAGQAAQDPQVHLIGRPLTQEPYGVAMNLADTDLVRKVNMVLQKYTGGGANSQWIQAYNKWLAHNLPAVSGPPPPLYKD